MSAEVALVRLNGCGRFKQISLRLRYVILEENMLSHLAVE